jgi:hypothetical protein
MIGGCWLCRYSTAWKTSKAYCVSAAHLRRGHLVEGLVLLQLGVQLAAFRQLQHEVDVLVVFEDGVQLDDPRVRQLAQDVHLVFQLVFHVVVFYGFLGYDFHRIVFVALPVLHFDHLAVRAW